MTLGQFATAVGATPRWVLNALTRLKVPRRYDEPLARRLSLARVIAEATRSALPEAFELAARALAEADPHREWRHGSSDGAITLTVDLPRFFTIYGARLTVALHQYGEKQRGRRPTRRKSAVKRAKEYGVDVTLLESQLRRTTAQRTARLSKDMKTVREMRRRAR